MVTVRKAPLKLMVVGGGNWQTYMIVRAKEMGFRTVVIDRSPEAPARHVADSFYPVDTSHIDEALSVARQENIDGVATFGTNDAIITVAAIKEELGLPSDCVPSGVAKQAVYKDTMRKCLAAHGVPIPAGMKLDPNEQEGELEQLLLRLESPLVIKPSDASGGKGITVVRYLDELPQAIRLAEKYLRSGCIIAEEYVEGTVIGVESIIQRGQVIGIAIADKTISPLPYCITLGVISPSALSQTIQKRILAVNAAAIDALEIRTGATHIDMVIGHDGCPKVVDVGPRLAGGPIIFEIIKRTMAVDMMEYVINAAFGRFSMIEPRWTGLYVGSRHFVATKEGVVVTLSCPKDILSRHRSTYLRFWKSPNDKVSPASNDADTIGFVVCAGDTYEETLSHLEAVSRAVVLNVSPGNC